MFSKQNYILIAALVDVYGLSTIQLKIHWCVSLVRISYFMTPAISMSSETVTQKWSKKLGCIGCQEGGILGMNPKWFPANCIFKHHEPW